MRRKRTRSEKSALSQRAMKAFEEWYSKRPDKNEIFVRLWNWNTQKIDCRRYVSNYGRAILFTDPDNPEFYDYDTFPIDGNGYKVMTIGNNRSGHLSRAVWFSFMYDAIVNGTEKPVLLSSYKINSVKDLSKASKFKGNDAIVIHHKDIDKSNNTVSNLQGIRKKYHDWYHKKYPKLKELIEGIEGPAYIDEKKNVHPLYPVEVIYSGPVTSEEQKERIETTAVKLLREENRI